MTSTGGDLSADLVAAWLWLIAHDDWCSFAYSKSTQPWGAPILSEAQCGAMDRACEELHCRGWARRRRQSDGPGWWYRADHHAGDHYTRTWSAARWLLDSGAR